MLGRGYSGKKTLAAWIRKVNHPESKPGPESTPPCRKSESAIPVSGHAKEHINDSVQPGQLTVVVPTYNEASNLEELVDALFALPLPNLRVVIVDDNSPDGTGPLADRLARRYNDPQHRITVIHRLQKAGLGTAYIEGFRRALADGAEFVMQMDADFSHNPAYIIPMLGVITATGMDVVIGSRYVPGGTLDKDWSLLRRLLSWWANVYCRAILRIRVRDMTAGFKLWQRTALLELGLETVRSNGYIFTVEMAYLCEKLGFRIIELPIHFEDRRIGQSKMNTRVKLESAWRVWELLWRHRSRLSQRIGAKQNNPLPIPRVQPDDQPPKVPTDTPT